MENDELLEFFKTFANVERLKIAGLLANEALAPTEIARRTGIAPVHVIRHLQRFQWLELIREAGSGVLPERIGAAPLTLNVAAIEQMNRRVLAGRRPRFNADELEGEAYERKVLGDFMTADGKLKAIPVQEKKLLVVLRYLARAFEPGQRYAEKQVNEILASYHEDTAALRRYLVDNNLLARSEGVYWKN